MKLHVTVSLRRWVPAPARCVLVVAVLGILGCAQARWSERVASPTAAAVDSPGAVPLPPRTQFDHSPELRAVFLESYAQGYTLGFTNAEYASRGCLCEAKGEEARYAAMTEGFFAGKNAGEQARAAKEKS